MSLATAGSGPRLDRSSEVPGQALPPEPPTGFWLDSGPQAEAALRPGVEADFARLYERAWGRLVASLVAITGSRTAAEDCAQEAAVRAFRAWDRWTPEAPAEAWLHRIAINVAINHRRRERLRQAGEVIRRAGRPAAAPDPAVLAERSDLLSALRRLPPRQAAAIVLRHLHGYTNRDIALALDVPERTVASRLAAARRRLEADLGEAWRGGIGTSVAGGLAPTRDGRSLATAQPSRVPPP